MDALDADNKLRVKLKGVGAYSIKKESTIFNLFHKIGKKEDAPQESQDESKEDLTSNEARLINAKEIIELKDSNEKLMEWVKFAFEKEKTVELEFSDVDKNSATITAVSVNS